MNFKMILFTLLLTLNSHAEYIDQVPSPFCRGSFANCSSASQKIIDQYFQGKSPQMNDKDSLYLGSCYMVGSNHDPEVEQFGYIYLRNDPIGIGFFGEFSFFANENPYQDLTLIEARARHSEISNLFVFDSRNHWQVRVSPDPLWQYFLREWDSRIQLIGFWGVDKAITCDFYYSRSSEEKGIKNLSEIQGP